MIPNLLKNWTVITWLEGQVFIVGRIYNAENGAIKDGTRFRTSRVLFIDFENRVARTQNAIYNLEEREVYRK